MRERGNSAKNVLPNTLNHVDRRQAERKIKKKIKKNIALEKWRRVHNLVYTKLDYSPGICV